MIHVAMSGDTHLDFTVNEKAKSSSAPGNLGFNQIELHRISKKEVEVREKKDGAPVAAVHEKLSSDGNVLTTTTTETGKAPVVTIWTRAAGVKDPKDPFGGDWTQDMSKTRMQQGLAVKIEASGNGGVRFTGDGSYTARFDGKPYSVKDSRNDTVSLALVDPHTVDAVYRRDNQVTQKDRWVIGSDGQMTVTSTGSYETGQRFTEKLVFKKQ
jgi:hypothetical protein